MRSRDALDEALSQLRRVIEAAVREEQLLDQLTSLPNDAALSEWLELALGKSKTAPFWVAFFEIDKFKRVNDEFGYEFADSLLCAVARQLAKGEDFFPGKAVAFRAHGDEFYLAGEMTGETVDTLGRAIDTIRASVGSLRLSVAGKSAPMCCTVSAGWVTSTQASLDESFGPREVRVMLEKAVSEAKRRGRDCVVRYSTELAKLELVSLRDNCPLCNAAFTVDYPVDAGVQGPLHCPNCGADVPRQSTPSEPVPLSLEA